MTVHQTFYLRRPDLEARRVDHAFDPIHHEEVTIFIVVTQIAGAEETLTIDFDERGLGIHGSIPVTQSDLRPAGNDLAGFSHAFFFKCVDIDNPAVDIKHRNAQTLGLGAFGWIDMGRCHGFRQTVAFNVIKARQLF